MGNTVPEAAGTAGYIGHYRLVSRLGAGGMGVVHLALSPSGRKVAVKIVHARHAEEPEFRARFRQEVAAARRVSGAFTAPVLDADPDAERPWMATLHIAGPTLSEHVRDGGPLPLPELLRLASGLAEALRDIHRAGVVHRDLKPSNVLLADDGPKVIDFGISRPYDSDLKTETGKLIGTPPFMAPEQFQRPREVGPAADVFALGSVLVHAATGRGPFDSDSPYLVAYQVVHDEPDLTEVPAELAPVIRSCLSKEPDRRPSPDALVAMVRAVGLAAPATEPMQAPMPLPAPAPVPSPEPEGGVRRRRVWWVAAAATALLALLAAAAVVVVRKQPEEQRTEPTATAGAGRARSVRAWEAAVPGAPRASAGAEARTAACAYADDALFCSDDGVAAARLDAATGKAGWSLPGTPGEPADWPVVTGGLVQVVSPDGGTLRAFDPRTGRVRWTKDVSAFGGFRFPAGAMTLLAAPGGEVSAVDGRTGRVRWTRSFPGPYRPLFAYAGGVAYGLSRSADADRTLVTALAPATGRTLWQHWFDGGALTFAGAAPGGGIALVSSNASGWATAVVRYDPDSGRTSRIRLPYQVSGPRVAASGGTVYLLGDDGALVAVGDHGVLWRLETSVSLPSPPAVAAGRMFFGARDGRLLTVDLRDGTLLGQTQPRTEAALRGYLGDQPPPIVAGRRVFSYAPDGTVFCEPLAALVSPAS